MSLRIFPQHEIETLKREATLLKKREGIPHHEALNRIAVLKGYPAWKDLRRALNSAVPESVPSVVRIVMDPKDVADFRDDHLARLGFARDDEFTNKLAEERDPEEPWAITAWIETLRFIKSPSGKTPREIADMGAAAFFFPPNEIWLDDKQVSDEEFMNIVPPRPKYSRMLSPADEVIEQHLPSLGEALLGENHVIRAAMGEHSDIPFRIEEGYVESADFVSPDRIKFVGSVVYTNTDEHIYLDLPEFDFDVSGDATRDGGSWKLVAATVKRFVRDQ